MMSKQSAGGFVLFMVLMIMVLMSITGLALMRAVDTGTLVANNVGFKQAAIISGEAGIKSATDWLNANNSLLAADHADLGYYATEQSNPDWTSRRTPVTTDDVDWDGTNSVAPIKAKAVDFGGGLTTDTSGNKAYYVIHRLCDNTGSSGAVGTSCATNESETAAKGSTKGGGAYGAAPMTITMQVFYRITVYVKGPRNTSSYTQAYVLI